ERARAAAPFLAFAPAAVYVATSPDAFYMGVFAIGVALFAVAAGRRGDAVGDACAFGSGLVLGASLFLTYGVVTLGAIVLALLVADFSGYARGETERVWLTFAPWLLIATCALSPSLRARQGWLALQVAAAIGLQIAAKGPW